MASRGPNVIRAEASGGDALFEDDAPVYPYTGRLVQADLADYLEQLVRVRPDLDSVELELGLRGPALRPEEEERVRTDVHRYFQVEAELCELEFRVNQREGRSSARFALPIIVVFGAIVVGIYYEVPSELLIIAAFFYLIAISIVWLMTWDPLEKILFTGFLIRARRKALEKLARSEIRFSYPAAPTAAVPVLG